MSQGKSQSSPPRVEVSVLVDDNGETTGPNVVSKAVLHDTQRKDVEAQIFEVYDSGKIIVQDQSTILPFKQLLFVFAGCSCALFCFALDQTIVGTAIPTIGKTFGNATISSWVGTAYLLTSVAFQPLYGRFSDIFGRKVVMQVSLAIFLIGSILCAVSQSMIMLIVSRAIAGIGGGGILTCVNVIVGDIVTPQKRGQWEGILGAVVAVSNAMGPVLGGVFSESVSWRWCFYIAIPLTCISIVVVAVALPLKGVRGNLMQKIKQIDYFGCALMTASATLVLIALSWGGTVYSWSSAGVLAPLILGLGLSVAFVLVEWKQAVLPIVPLHIFKNNTITGVVIGCFFSGVMTYSNLYYLPQYYQVVHGSTPTESGLLLIPLVVSQTLTSLITGLLVSMTGNYYVQLVIGFAIWAVGCGLLSTVTPSIPNSYLIGYQILNGIGAGQTFMTGLVAIQATSTKQDLAVSTGMRNFMRLLGGALALAAFAAVLNNTVQTDATRSLSSDNTLRIIEDPTRIRSPALGLSDEEQAMALEAYCHGVRTIYQIMIGCSIISLIATVFMVKNVRMAKEVDNKDVESPKENVQDSPNRKSFWRFRARDNEKA